MAKTKQQLLPDYEGPSATFSYVIFDVSAAFSPTAKFKTVGAQGIIVPQKPSESAESSIPKSGVVVSVGPECKQIKVGDRVIFPTGKTTMIDWEEKPSDKKYVAALEGNIAGVFV